MRKLLLWVFVLLSCVLASAQRLPRTAVPEHYSLWLDPDLKTGSLTGREEIRVKIPKRTRVIWLNSVGLKIGSVRVAIGEREIQSIAAVDEAKEMLEITFPENVAAGTATLKIEYSGRIREDLKGLYLSKTARRTYAVTQFEGTYARMMFPSFDEPEYKATFDISVVADEGDTAISNGAIANEKPGPTAGKHTITFATSPRMSTYLVALAVGDWKCSAGGADGIPIRICSLPEKEKLTTFALSATESFMKFYNQYYSIKYPFKKLDMVAIPDYEWGGMENTASIFYKERALLVDESTASVDAKRGVASVVAHEMAHQWFGDLVTTKWWDDIWLNEGFATWMTPKALSNWDPQWDQKPEIAQTKAFVMRLDARASTRPIHGKGETPAEIKELFDGVAYQKGASVLHMMESYLGEEAFRKGVNAYLERYANGNATSENFWAELEKASGKPVAPIMKSYVFNAGVPLVSLPSCDGKSCEMRQERFGNTGRATWTIPVCVRSLASTASACEVFGKSRQTVKTRQAPFLMNTGGTGYYRTAYPAEQLTAIRNGWGQVTPAERLTILDDTWALVGINRTAISSALDLTEALQQEKNRTVIELMLPRLQQVERMLDKADDRAKFARWETEQLAPITKEIGFMPGTNDSDDVKSLRASLLATQAHLGDAEAQKVATELANKYLDDPASVDASLGNEALRAAAANGDAALYDRIEKKLETAASPQLYFQYLISLTAFREPTLNERSLAMLVSPKMREQDAGSFLAGLVRNPESRDAAWKFLQDHWSELKDKIVSFGGSGAVGALGGYCSAEKEKEVRDFFEKHELPGAERSIKGSLEEIRNCTATKQAQGADLEKWLAQQR